MEGNHYCGPNGFAKESKHSHSPNYKKNSTKPILFFSLNKFHIKSIRKQAKPKEKSSINDQSQKKPKKAQKGGLSFDPNNLRCLSNTRNFEVGFGSKRSNILGLLCSKFSSRYLMWQKIGDTHSKKKADGLWR